MVWTGSVDPTTRFPDLTGGETELRNLARGVRALGAGTTVRTNLKIMSTPEHEDLPRFSRMRRVHGRSRVQLRGALT